MVEFLLARRFSEDEVRNLVSKLMALLRCQERMREHVNLVGLDADQEGIDIDESLVDTLGDLDELRTRARELLDLFCDQSSGALQTFAPLAEPLTDAQYLQATKCARSWSIAKTDVMLARPKETPVALSCPLDAEQFVELAVEEFAFALSHTDVAADADADSNAAAH
jgi:hypothetical protein